jgi:ABC-type glutathione transport system ATPase component
MAILEVEGLSKSFHSGLLRRRVIQAVEEVSFEIRSGTTLGLIGESGSGKSTLARLITGLIAPTAGRICFMGQDISGLKGRSLKRLRRRLQIIFQNPETAFNPRMKLKAGLSEPLRIHGLARGKQLDESVQGMASLVGLSEELLGRYPHELSGGQIQRAVLARVLALQPELIIFDEPTSMLDLSYQAQILNLIKTVQAASNLTYLFVSHDLDVIRFMSDSVAVLQKGRLVESGSLEEVFSRPVHPYTKELVSAAL